MKTSSKGFFSLFSFVSFLLTCSLPTLAITNSVPQLQAVYGGRVSAINVIVLAGSPDVSRIFAATESANSVFYADVDHSNPLPFATNVFSFQVVPDLSAEANFGTVNAIAGHPASGKLFICDDAGLMSCSMTSNTLTTNIVGQTTPGSPTSGYGTFSEVLISNDVLLAISAPNDSNVVHFGTLDASGNLTVGADSPLNIGVIESPHMVVHPINNHLYILGTSSSNILKSSTSISALSSATTFTNMPLPAAVIAWPALKQMGVGPDGRLFVGSANTTNYKVMAYSDDDGSSWTNLDTGIGGTSGDRIETGSDSSKYSVYFGSAMSTNKGEANSWSSIPRDQSQPPASHANDGQVRVDPNDDLVVYMTTDQGIGTTTNDCWHIFEIDNGLQAVQIQDFDMTTAKDVAWTAAKSGIRRAVNFQSSPQWSDAIFPFYDGSPYYSVAVDRSDTSGLTVYACNLRIYYTADGGTNWTKLYEPGDGSETFFFSSIEVYSNYVYAGRYMESSYNGGLMFSDNGGTSWTNVALSGTNGVNVNDVLLTEESGTMVVYVGAVYNTDNATGGDVYRVTLGGSTHMTLGSTPISVRDLAKDSTGRIYASGVNSNYNPVVFYKDLASSNWVQLTTNGLNAAPPTNPQWRGPVMTVGIDASSNEVPIVASGITLYYLPSGGAAWVTSAALRYPEGTQINVLYWDDLMIGTDCGLYGQELSLQAEEQAASVPLAADFDGDQLADPAVYNTNGNWKVKLSTANYTLIPLTGFLGGSGYTGLAADFDGDGLADPTIYSAALELWAVKLSSLNYLAPTVLTSFGGSGWQAIAGDFDGDAYADPALYNTNGTWKVKLSTANYTTITSTGLLGFADWTAIAADLDGDGLADPTIYHASTGSWIMLMSKLNYAVAIIDPGFLGGTGYVALAADFDGDAKADPAVAETSTGHWQVKLSSGNYSLVDLPDFLGE